MSRVFGLETEFGLLRLGADGRAEDPARTADELMRHRPPGYRGTNLFLPNGGRLYLDVGSHPEYATAECATVRQLVAQDEAGRALIASMAGRAARAGGSGGVEGAGGGGSATIHVLANNNDSAGHTYGCHENYSLPRRVSPEAILPVLCTFLATRPVLVGSGAPAPASASGDGQEREDGEDSAWALSPRAPHLRALASADTTGERALVNTRDEPHADPGRLRRLHITCADTTMSSTTTGLRAALTILLLDALEAGVDMGGIVLADPLEALASLGSGPWGDRAARARDGRALTPVDVQEEILARLLDRLDAVGAPPALEGAEHLVRDLAPRVIGALRAREAGAIDTEIDWAIKRRVMRAHRRRHPDLRGQELSVLRRRVDLAYHDLDTNSGLTQRLRAQGQMAELCSPQEIERAVTQAPPTRAALRGAFIQACLDRDADFSVTWSSIRLDSPPSPAVDLLDPAASSDPAAEALIGRTRALLPEEIRRIRPPGL
ncbi:proteasome accessory factor PafA2 family protein [Actinomyces marmotae]|uniref:proteasome accessory factor PafA2 family protein n=1 Tax=Actinomyces marmotae TaxID=2737173 RepID=UPI0013575260|nr:proteasome accessory factor PafA2 family protein [Actinomyces marmotae]